MSKGETYFYPQLCNITSSCYGKCKFGILDSVLRSRPKLISTQNNRPRKTKIYYLKNFCQKTFIQILDHVESSLHSGCRKRFWVCVLILIQPQIKLSDHAFIQFSIYIGMWDLRSGLVRILNGQKEVWLQIGKGTEIREPNHLKSRHMAAILLKKKHLKSGKKHMFFKWLEI